MHALSLPVPPLRTSAFHVDGMGALGAKAVLDYDDSERFGQVCIIMMGL